jgi:hypothetical protein
MHDLLHADGSELHAARLAAHAEGPIAATLDAMHGAGYWMGPGPGYHPKYRSTGWAVILLAQLGARVELDERIAWACDYVLDHALAEDGRFSAPGGMIDCLQGNLCWALVRLGCGDPRLNAAYEWMARSVTGEGIAPAGGRRVSSYFMPGLCRQCQYRQLSQSSGFCNCTLYPATKQVMVFTTPRAKRTVSDTNRSILARSGASISAITSKVELLH